MCFRFPGTIFYRVTFPFDKVLLFAIVGAGIDDLFGFEFFLVINDQWCWGIQVAVRKFYIVIGLVGLQKIGVEHWVDFD